MIRAFGAIAGAAGLALLLAAGARAQTPAPQGSPSPARDINEADAAAIQIAVNLGREIYLRDQAAWHVSDAMVAANPGAATRPVVGWVTRRVDDQLVTAIFLRRDGDRYREFFSGETRGSELVDSRNNAADPDAPLVDPELVKGFEAIAVVKAEFGEQLCGRRPNYVVLPSAAVAGGWDVYAIVPEQTRGEAALAGHRRVTIGPDGRIADVHPYSNSCLIGRYDGETVALTVTLPADRGVLPNEMHVFESLTHRKPIYVGAADGRIWVVEGAQVRLLDQTAAR